MIERSSLPTDGNSKPVQLTPAKIALARTVSSSISSSTEIDFNAATTFIRCYANNQDVYLKWGTTAVTSSNFDEIIPAGQIVDLVIPYKAVDTLYPSCTVIQVASTATITVIEK